MSGSLFIETQCICCPYYNVVVWRYSPRTFKYAKKKQKKHKLRKKIVFRSSQQCVGACFASHISAVNQAIRVFLHRSIDV